MASRCIALRAVHHPAFLSLQGHLTRLAEAVMLAACMRDGVLLPQAKAQWIRDALPTLEAEVLMTLLWVSGEDVDEDLRSVFDPLSETGRSFQGGRTICPWQDSQVAVLADAFDRLCADRRRQWTSVKVLVEKSQLPEELAVGSQALFLSPLRMHGHSRGDYGQGTASAPWLRRSFPRPDVQCLSPSFWKNS